MLFICHLCHNIKNANRYFIYARKSTDEENKRIMSISAQLSELREFARKENLSVVQEFTESRTAKESGGCFAKSDIIDH